MNQHVPPPPPRRDEPPWLQEVRELVATVNHTSAQIEINVARYIRWVKYGVLVILGAQAFGLLLNWAVMLWVAK